MDSNLYNNDNKGNILVIDIIPCWIPIGYCLISYSLDYILTLIGIPKPHLQRFRLVANLFRVIVFLTVFVYIGQRCIVF